MKDTTLWIAQRVSAMVLAFCVLVHLATMVYAVRGGLTAADVLGRTKGNLAWLAFYSLFVIAIAVHVPVGLRAVFNEWLGWRGTSRQAALIVLSLLLLFMGMRAVLGVFL